MKLITRGNAPAKGMTRLFFTCHPEDFDKYFDLIREDIFKSHSCAIYFDDADEQIENQEREFDLSQMNLFVIPITYQLLTSKCRTIEKDLPFALKNNIPILPIVVEEGLDELYSAKFGSIQYLNRINVDDTAIGYDVKLDKYLDTIIVSDDFQKLIRAAFDAYIFLSYRKKDRVFANELMKLIHQNPDYQDIAIWYDEYLTPGEAFDKNIEEALKKSKLFMLVVTPNLINEENYVKNVEYPKVKESEISIFPAEMKKTNYEELLKQFVDLPECIDYEDRERFINTLEENLKRIATSTNDKSPEHNYLMGLAYMTGLDVEVDREKGFNLIKYAADSGIDPAIQTLAFLYDVGNGVDVDIYKANEYYIKHAASLLEKKRIDDKGINSIITAAESCVRIGRPNNAIKMLEALLDLVRVYYKDDKEKENHVISNLIAPLIECGDFEKAKELSEIMYKYYLEKEGEESINTINALNNLSVSYDELGYYEERLKLAEKVYELRKKTLGELSDETLRNGSNLVGAYVKAGEYDKAEQLALDILEKQKNELGENNLDYTKTLNNLALAYHYLNKKDQCFETIKKTYETRVSALGEDHPYTLRAAHNLIAAYADINKYNEALELAQKNYDKARNNTQTTPWLYANTAYNLGGIYSRLDQCSEAAPYLEEALDLFVKNNNEVEIEQCLDTLYYVYTNIIKDDACFEQFLDKVRGMIENKEKYDVNLDIALQSLIYNSKSTKNYERLCKVFDVLMGVNNKMLIENPSIYEGLSKIASEYEEGNELEKALGAYSKLSTLCKKSPDDEILAFVCKVKQGEILRSLKQYEASSAALMEALSDFNISDEGFNDVVKEQIGFAYNNSFEYLIENAVDTGNFNQFVKDTYKRYKEAKASEPNDSPITQKMYSLWVSIITYIANNWESVDLEDMLLIESQLKEEFEEQEEMLDVLDKLIKVKTNISNSNK